MDGYTVIKYCNDPNVQGQIKKLLENASTILLDECGKEFVIERVGMFNVPYPLLERPDVAALMQEPWKTKIRNDDIFLFTHPRTGTHWVGNLIHFLRQSGPLEDIKPLTPFPIIELMPEEVADAIPSPRLLHSHAHPFDLPSSVFSKHRKIIMTVRNPKDTAVSMFYFAKKDPFSGPVSLTWDTFIECFTKGLFPLIDFFSFYKEWQKYLDDHKEIEILVVRYESLHQDPVGELKRIQKYLGLSHNDERLLAVLKRCSLSNLKDDDKRQMLPFSTDFVYRKGTIDDWKNYFTVAQSEAMDKRIAEEFPSSMFKFQPKDVK